MQTRYVVAVIALVMAVILPRGLPPASVALAARSAVVVPPSTQLLGDWVNTNTVNPGVVEISLQYTTYPSVTFTVHTYVSCNPTPCDWGTVTGSDYATSVASSQGMAFTASYDQGFAERIVTGYLQNGTLLVSTFTQFKDGSGRSNYLLREQFQHPVIGLAPPPLHASPPHLAALDTSGLIGTWNNTNPSTGGTARIMLQGTNGVFTVHGFGACVPSYCDYGTAPGTVYAVNVSSPQGTAFTAVYNFSFAQDIMTGYLDNGTLVTVEYTRFTDGSGRSDYYDIEHFTRVPQPLLTTVVADRSSSVAGGLDGYTVTIQNPNTVSVPLTTITDVLPAGFAYTAGSTSGITNATPARSGQTLTWNGSFSVPSSGRVSLHFGVRVSSVPGDYFDQAGGTAGDVPVTPSGPAAQITVLLPLTTSVTADRGSVSTGGIDGYTITIHNPNPLPAALTKAEHTLFPPSATVTSILDTLPAGFTYSPGSTTGISTAQPLVSGQTLTWNGSFSVADSKSVSLHFAVRAPSLAGDYFDQAGGTATGTVVTSSGLSARVRVIAPLIATLIADSPTTIPGGTDGYTIALSNPNPWPMTATSILQTLPAGFSAIPLTTSGITTTDPTVAGSSLTWSGSYPLSARGSISLHLRVQVPSTLGSFSSQVGGSAIGNTVTPSGLTAPISISGTSRTVSPSVTYSGNYQVVSAQGGCPPFCQVGTYQPASGGFSLWLPQSTLSFTELADYSASAGYVCAEVTSRATVTRQDGDMTITSVLNGSTSTLTGVYRGTSCFKPSDPYVHIETAMFWITGGTGRFLNAGGAGSYSGTRQCARDTCFKPDDQPPITPPPGHHFTFTYTIGRLTMAG